MKFRRRRKYSATCPVVTSINNWKPRCAQDINTFTEPALGATNQSRRQLRNGARFCWYEAVDTTGDSL